MNATSERLIEVLTDSTTSTAEAVGQMGVSAELLRTPKPSRPSTADAFTLWYRAHRQTGWRAVATGKTRAEAVAQIGCGGRKGGMWYVGGAFAPKPPSSRQGFADANPSPGSEESTNG